MSFDENAAGKNELVRHLLACLVYRVTKIIHDAPENYPLTKTGCGVRTPLKVLGHINSLIQLSNRFWGSETSLHGATPRRIR